jgi:uncharacterized membrane protein
VGAESFLIDPAKANMSVSDAIAVGLGSLVIGWGFYDLLCRSPLQADNRVLGVVWFCFLLGTAILLNHMFTARGAYLHIGAIIGTVMVGNVFFIIIPNQRKVVAELIAGRVPNPALGKAAKQRSLHNNYMTLPVLFIMISPHYPMTYGADRPWLVLALLGLLGVAVRHGFNLRHRGVTSLPLLATIVALALITVTYVSMERAGNTANTPAEASVTYADIQPILVKHCTGCHSFQPTNPAFKAPPLGLVFDSYEHVSALALRIKKVAVDAEVMPLGNQTGMTTDERQKLGGWITQGTPR